MAHRVRLHVKYFWLLLVLASCAKSKSEGELKWYNEKQVPLQNVAGLYKVNGSLFSGVVYRLAENNKDTVAVAGFLNGRENGEWRQYYSNGQLMERRYYSNGQKTGLYEGWWPNGTMRLAYHFTNGEYEGYCRDWSINGTLIRNMQYKKGYEDGLQQQFYENGKVKANYMMINGRRYGLLGTKNCVNVSDSIFKK